MASATAVAQPAAPPVQSGATEDRDAPVTDTLPWYMPPPRDETPPPALHRKAQQYMATLGRQSLSGDLSGAINELVLTYGSRDVEFGAAIASADLHLTDQTSAGVMRRVNNDGTAFLATLGIGRNWGIDIYDEEDVHVHLLLPSLRIQAGAASAQDINDTLPATMGDAQTVGMAGISLALVGLRLSTCSGWIADIRAPVLGAWGAIRTFDPSMSSSSSGTMNSDITSSGSSWGVELEVGHVFWQ